MPVKVRFAPSPTGRLHVGNIYIALHNWLFARKRGGHFLLRLDDTDRDRSSESLARFIEEDLLWLGLTFDEFAAQSQRLARYDAAAARLRAIGRLYPCYETAEELALKRKVQLTQGKPPVYDREALRLDAAVRARLEAEGRRPHWRFRLKEERVEWTDLVRGPQHVDESSQSDPILIREDGTYLYTLTSVVDDIELDVTHVIRGADHVTNTATQSQIFAALDAPPPFFAHLPLLTDAGGAGLSKRLGALSVADLRRQGLEPMTINAYLARIGSGDALEPKLALADLLDAHDLARFSKGSPRFDAAELRQMNARLLHVMPHQAAAARLQELGQEAIDADLWEAARSNLETLADLPLWRRICRGEIVPIIEDAAYAAHASDLLPPEPWSGETWQAWTAAVAAATARKGRALFHPLRLALTGQEEGPAMKALLPLIGRARAQRRLRGETA